MGLLKKAVNEQAFLKAGILGFPGSGKTFTASMLAIGISQRMGGKKPVAFFDTETGSDFLIPRFEAEGVELLRVKSQAFTDLLAVGKEAEGVASVLIVDSITHVWRELCESYQKRKNIKRLEFQHWADLKREWNAWTTLYLNSRMHIFVLGRAGYEYEMEKNADTGKKELTKAGTKMKVETEFGFEPSLLIEMVRADRDGKPGSGWSHEAYILKDRTDTINGNVFKFEKPRKSYKKGDWAQTLKPFQPVFDALNIGGEHIGVDASRTSEERFSGPNGESEGVQRRTRAQIACEEIQGSMMAIWPGQDAPSKKMKATTLQALFGTRSWTAAEQKPVEELEHAVRALRMLETKAKEVQFVEGREEQGLVELIDECMEDTFDFKGKTIAQDELPASFNPQDERATAKEA